LAGSDPKQGTVQKWRIALEVAAGTQSASLDLAQSKVRTRLAELHLEVASKLSDDAALTVEQHMTQLRELRDDARQRGQLSAAIQAEVKRGELRRFYVRQVENRDVGEFDRMTTEELRAFVYGGQSGEGSGQDETKQDETKH
jgi:hypothetical protein